MTRGASSGILPTDGKKGGGKMKVYTDGDTLGIAVSDSKDKILIFDTVEGEAGVDFYKGGEWDSFDIEELACPPIPEAQEASTLQDEADEVISQGREETLDELPEDIRKIVVEYDPEFLAYFEEDPEE